MDGLGVPLVTPFTESGELDEQRLRALVDWLLDRGVDFLVPCGSTSEAPLLSPDERVGVVQTVADAADVPVLAGTGYAGFHQTVRTTNRAAVAGADGALVVTPYYYDHDQETLAAYYREVADAVDVPVYLYSVPAYTDVALDPETVGSLADHGNVHGIKDSAGDLGALHRIRRLAPDLDVLVGSGSVHGHGLAAGADGAILALANVVPEDCRTVLDRVASGDLAGALELNGDLVELNRALTGRYGIPGIKAAMRERGAPAGYARRPFRPPGEEARRHLGELLAALDRHP